MKHIMISIKPEWVCKILNGEKILEIRKSIPKDLPCKVYIYCTKDRNNLCIVNQNDSFIYKTTNIKCCHLFGDGYFGNGNVVASFTLMHYTKFDIPFPAYWKDLPDYIKEEIPEKSCLSLNELHHYLDDKTGYAWHIEDLHIYDTPKDISEFYSTRQRDRLECDLCGWQCFSLDTNKIEIKIGKCVKNKLKRPPQSWCYIKGEDDDKL